VRRLPPRLSGSTGAGGTLTGLPLDALATSFPRSVVRYVISTEVACGRVHEDDGFYSLVPECFDREVLLALRSLVPVGPELPESAHARALAAAHGDESPRPRRRPSERSDAGREAVSA
jgi:hypothetical protein